MRRRCAETDCRHAPRAHDREIGACRLCDCTHWLDRKRHTWRDQVTVAWESATEAWLDHREAVAIGYRTEEREFEEHHPRPRLADFMAAMSPGVAPEVLDDLTRPCRCCEAAQRAKAS